MNASKWRALETAVWALTFAIFALSTSLRLKCFHRAHTKHRLASKLEMAGPARIDATSEAAAVAELASKTLAFEVCDGFANQRLSLLYGLLIAKQLGRVVVLPSLTTDSAHQSAAAGGQPTPHGAASPTGQQLSSRSLPFKYLYDISKLQAVLSKHGVSLLSTRPHAIGPEGTLDSSSAASSDTAIIDLSSSQPISSISQHFASHQSMPHMRLSCPLYKLSPAVILSERRFVSSILAALQLAPALQQRVDFIVGSFPDGRFNFIHLRLERDWQEYCERCEGRAVCF